MNKRKTVDLQENFPKLRKRLSKLVDENENSDLESEKEKSDCEKKVRVQEAKMKFIFKYSKTKKGKEIERSSFISFNMGAIPNLKLTRDIHIFEEISIKKFTKLAHKPITEEESFEILKKIVLKTERDKSFKMLNKSKKIKKIKKNSPQDLINKNKLIKKCITKAQIGYNRKMLAYIFQIKKNKIDKSVYKAKKNIEPIIDKKGRKSIIRPKYLDYINNILSRDEGKLYFVKNIRDKLFKKFEKEFEKNKIKLSIETVRNWIWRAGYSRQRASGINFRINLQKNIDDRYNVCRKFLYFTSCNYQFVFLDETGFNINFHPPYIYSKRNEPHRLKLPDKSQNYSVVCAIDKYRVLGIQIMKGAFKGIDFTCFLISLIKNQEWDEKDLEKIIFFMDNAKIHKSKATSNFFSKLNILYNSPYSPFLNPIEEVFGMVKFKFKFIQYKNPSHIINNIYECFKSVTSTQIFRTYKHVFEFYENCIRKNPL